MSIIEQLKKERLEARKKSDTNLSSFLAFAISEIEKVGKDDGNRETSEDEAIKTIEKIVGKIDETIALTQGDSKPELLEQKNVLIKYVPEKVSNDDVREFLKCIVEENPNANKGIMMKELKTKFGSSVDMKSAGSIVDEVLNG